jgi:hypothetical protein
MHAHVLVEAGAGKAGRVSRAAAYQAEVCLCASFWFPFLVLDRIE